MKSRASHSLNDIWIAIQKTREQFGQHQVRVKNIANNLHLHPDLLTRLIGKIRNAITIDFNKTLTLNFEKLLSFRSLSDARDYFGEEIFDHPLMLSSIKTSLRQIHGFVHKHRGAAYATANELGIHHDALQVMLKHKQLSFNALLNMPLEQGPDKIKDYDEEIEFGDRRRRSKKSANSNTHSPRVTRSSKRKLAEIESTPESAQEKESEKSESNESSESSKRIKVTHETTPDLNDDEEEELRYPIFPSSSSSTKPSVGATFYQFNPIDRSLTLFPPKKQATGTITMQQTTSNTLALTIKPRQV